MREILFRGKRKDNGEWVEGNLFIPDKLDTPTQICIGTNIIRITYDVIPETVGQYTGLTDKNGKKIFEGDIHERENHFFVVKYGKYRDCETNEDEYGWYFEYTHRKGCEGFDGTESQYVNIIGNIHDNPELLKEGEG